MQKPKRTISRSLGRHFVSRCDWADGFQNDHLFVARQSEVLINSFPKLYAHSRVVHVRTRMILLFTPTHNRSPPLCLWRVYHSSPCLQFRRLSALGDGWPWPYFPVRVFVPLSELFHPAFTACALPLFSAHPIFLIPAPLSGS